MLDECRLLPSKSHSHWTVGLSETLVAETKTDVTRMANNFVNTQGPDSQGFGPAHVDGHAQNTTQLTGVWPAHVPVLQLNTHGELEDVNTVNMVPERESVTTLMRIHHDSS